MTEFKCDQCDKKYNYKDNLKRHHAVKHSMIRYNCEQCDAKYIDISSLRIHVRDKHEGEKSPVTVVTFKQEL